VCGESAGFGARFPAMIEGFEVGACHACGALRTLPDVPDDQIGPYYGAAYYGFGNRRFNPLMERATIEFRKQRARRFAAHMKERGRVLDVGCGRGLTLAALRELGLEPYGVEQSDEAAWHAREVLHLDVSTDLFAEHLEPGTFRGVFFWHSLEHIRRADLAIERAAQLLAPGGALCVAVPNSDSLQARVFGRHWFHLDVPRHYHHFTHQTLTQLLARFSLGVESVEEMNLEQNPYGVIQSALNKAGVPENLLYSMLKTSSARVHDIKQHPVGALVSAAAAGPLTALSLAWTAAESALGHGGTIELWARRA
jgi:2-polyprenyl-3-methyl-5-hydroxy-6-metoxy-1,4-benzoquinol methylase